MRRRSLQCWFQFHTGSIKRGILQRASHLKNEFQFHTGSIKSYQDLLLNLPKALSFNSILVRLKDTRPFDKKTETPTFQFHTGSIKRSKEQKAHC